MSAFIVLALLCLLGLQEAKAVTWRIFSTTTDCVTTHVPEPQWKLLRPNPQLGRDPQDIRLQVDYAFLATATKSGLKSSAFVDVWLVDSMGVTVNASNAISEAEESHELRGGSGPWQLCFRQRGDTGQWRPSVEIQLSYFTVDVRAFKGTDFEASKLASTNVGRMDYETLVEGVSRLPSAEHVSDLYSSLQHLDRQLQAVGSEQKHLQHRTEWHLAALHGTHSRMLFWSSVQILGFGVAAALQVMLIRGLFMAKPMLGFHV